MKREKEFEINGCIIVPEDLNCDDFWDKFIDFIEANNWSFGGGINEIIDGFYINEDRANGDHVLDQDLKELNYQGDNKNAVEVYMDLTGSDNKEAQAYVADLSKRLWGNIDAAATAESIGIREDSAGVSLNYEVLSETVSKLRTDKEKS